MKIGYNIVLIFKYAIAFAAFNIGSGFATGQEVMQFFTQYGYFSIGTIAICMIMLSFIGSRIMLAGFDNKNSEMESAYVYFCGKYLGRFFDLFIVVKQFAIVAVMISGTGAIFNQYFELPHYAGAAVMAFAILFAYFLGLKNLINIGSAVGFIVIAYIFIVCIVSLWMNIGEYNEIGPIAEKIHTPTFGRNWITSGVLYSSFVLYGTVHYYAALGKSAPCRKDALYGGIIGGVLFSSVALLINLAMLTGLGGLFDKEVPFLILAAKTSPVMGGIFSVVLLFGIFSSTAPKLWIVCSRINREGTAANRLSAIAITAFAFLFGQLPFATLISVIYPIVGFIGLLLVGSILYKSFVMHKQESQSKTSP